ncbi:MAG TPA: Nif3-like dinuclear metal center hexameric protein [Acidimicrobiia bacterium]|jgi:putative NIF3 family GTP cyclohydrolase 1 type 2|nr:Nif3-like dinuclear metal center hexameric protein [Acidimicrobiia bacterium]
MSPLLRAGDVAAYLTSLAPPWEYPDDTVDTFKAGGPDTEVTGIAVAWLPFTWALHRAIELGCSLFVTHEPTYYDHHDRREELFQLEIPAGRRALLEEAGMAVLRCHDLWDRFPGEGITTSWGDHLGLDRLVDSDDYSRVYAIDPTTAREFAAVVASRTAGMGQPGVHLIGDGDRRVETVCIGTGAISPYLELVSRFEPDLVICTDDGMDYWRDGAFAVDGGPPIVVVHHGVTEEPGVARLAERLRRAFPDIPVHHIEQRCMYEFVSPLHSGQDVGEATAGGDATGDDRQGGTQ